MLDVVEQLGSEGRDIRAVVMLTSRGPDGVKGGTSYTGYDDDGEAIADMLKHVQAAVDSCGGQLHFIGLDDPPAPR
jgi:hypothetical protein